MNQTKLAVSRRRTLCAGILFLLALPLLAAHAARAADNRFTLAGQDDWSNKRGFYVDFENSSSGDTACALASTKLAVGVADGTSWRFIVLKPSWQYDRDYHIRVLIDSAGASVSLDGKATQQSPGAFAADNGDLTAAAMQSWANGPAVYQIEPEKLSIESSGSKNIALAWPAPTRRQIALSLFSQQIDRTVSDWHPGSVVTIEATFRIIPKPRWQDFAPMIDRYGQAVYADWPGKVTNDGQIRKALADEDRRLAAWGVPKDYDQYGGYLKAGWKAHATGYYRVEKQGGKWWLITPLGNPCFYTGLCTAPNEPGDFTPVTDREKLYAWLPSRTGLNSGAWGKNAWGENSGADYVAFSAATAIRLYGTNWKKHEDDLTARRIRTWGFSGIGKWGDLAGVPSVPVLEHGDVPNIARHPDIFDPAVQAKFHDSLTAQIAPHLKDPNIVGWSLGNEYDEIITPDEITTILGKDADTPAKHALVDHALTNIYGGDIGKMASAWQVAASSLTDLYQANPKPPAPDIETLRRFYASRYYAFIYKTIKAIDPNHLYLGFWIVPNWWVNESDWSLIAPYCDVIGYDHYSATFSDPNLTRWMKQTDKPILCGEFSFPPDYGGQRAFGKYGSISVTTEAEAGDYYAQWIKDATANPCCVGLCWFEYRDEPITGRGPGRGTDLIYGEDYAFGLVDVAGRPKWDLVTRIRQANLAAARMRLARSFANE